MSRIFRPPEKCNTCENLSRCGADLTLSDCEFRREVKSENVPAPISKAEDEFSYRRLRRLLYMSE